MKGLEGTKGIMGFMGVIGIGTWTMATGHWPLDTGHWLLATDLGFSYQFLDFLVKNEFIPVTIFSLVVDNIAILVEEEGLR